MNHIQLLDDHLINKIAAGEVVERPASVVKELVENCIDAKATKITVELQEGGRKRILVSDNGTGMTAADAEKSILRHATSKIKTTEDLFSLQTMGFRGEALASISAVCKFTLMTCKQGFSEGVRLEVDAEGQVEKQPWQSSGGTTIICDDIFYNIPVRQKFLKAAAAEYGAVLEFMQAVALSHPDIDFTLVNNGKEVLRAAVYKNKSIPEDSLRARFAQVMRGDAGLGMIFVESSCAYGSMRALISAPGVERNSAKDMFLFINGRWIKDKSIRFAVLRGYHSHLLRGKYPVVALFLEMDPGLVDANVHPSKTEVRIQYATEIHSMVASAVREGLRKGEWASAPIQAITGRNAAAANDFDNHSDSDSDNDSLESRGPLRSTFKSGSAPSASSAIWRDVTPSVFGVSAPTKQREDDLFIQKESRLFAQSFASSFSPSFAEETKFVNSKTEVIQSIPWQELCYMGSIADCYLLFSHGNRETGARLLGVDQHAFHERVLYERLVRNSSLLKASQPLLVPEGVVLDHGSLASLHKLAPLLEDNGFKLEFVDDVTVEVKAIPAILNKADLQALLESLANHEHENLPLDYNVGLAHDILSTMACHSAVRAGEKLGEVELKMLINEAKDIDFFHNCPHGRRVFKWWDEAQIARWFDR